MITPEITQPVLFLLGLGFAAAVILAIASKIFYVWEDPKIEEVEDSLLGANCGGCGYPGCAAAAAAVVKGVESADICVAGGYEIALQVAEVMGQEVEMKEPEIAYTSCRYNLAEADTRFTYAGVSDCRAAAMYSGGPKECPIGCIGLGTCERACPFSAITMNDRNLPVFDKDKCTACGTCVEVCPKDIIYLTSTTNRMIGDFRNDECTTPCQRSCPTGIDIPGYIRQAAAGNYREAVRIIRERNPMPSVVGRICPAPCEMDCRRNLVDESVAINGIKRYVADHEMMSGTYAHPFMAPKSGEKVAVVGGGPQGLSTAYYLACLGVEPVIYEGTDTLGGIIRRVIPRSRLPREIIDWDIRGILDAGVTAETGKRLGKDFTVASLLDQGYRAVALATGGIDSRQIMTGEESPNVLVPGLHLLIDFLKFASASSAPDLGRVFIAGGGNSAVQAARLCKEMGAPEVTVVYPFSREEMIANGVEVDAAEEGGGISFLYTTVVNGFYGDGEKLAGISVRREVFQPEDLPADTLIAAVGRFADLVIVPNRSDEGERLPGWRTIDSYRMQPDNLYDDMFNLNEYGLFNDNLGVIHSLARGRRVARSMLLHLGGKDVEPQEHRITRGMKVLNTDEVDRVIEHGRNAIPRKVVTESYSDTDALFYDGELEPGFTEAQAVDEAKRCLDCGLICYKRTVS